MKKEELKFIKTICDKLDLLDKRLSFLENPPKKEELKKEEFKLIPPEQIPAMDKCFHYSVISSYLAQNDNIKKMFELTLKAMVDSFRIEELEIKFKR